MLDLNLNLNINNKFEIKKFNIKKLRLNYEFKKNLVNYDKEFICNRKIIDNTNKKLKNDSFYIKIQNKNKEMILIHSINIVFFDENENEAVYSKEFNTDNIIILNQKENYIIKFTFKHFDICKLNKTLKEKKKNLYRTLRNHSLSTMQKCRIDIYYYDNNKENLLFEQNIFIDINNKKIKNINSPYKLKRKYKL